MIALTAPQTRFSGCRAPFLVVAATVVPVLVLYLFTLAPGVLEGDSAELQRVPAAWGIAHPTGYPSYTIIGHAFTWLPVGNIAYRMNLFSAVCAALACGMVALVGIQIGLRRSTSVGVGLVVAASQIFWSQAVIAEVYALNTLCLFSATALANVWIRNRKLIALLGMALVIAVGIGNHQSTTIALPLFGAYLLLARPRGQYRQVVLAALLLIFAVAGFYLYLFAAAHRVSPNDLARATRMFLGWVTAERWQDAMFSFGIAEMPGRIVFYGRLLVEQITWVGVILMCVGLARRWTPAWLLVCGLALENVVYSINYDVPDIAAFFLPSFACCSLLCGKGLDRLLPESWSRLAILALALFLAVSNFQTNNQSQNREYELWADRVVEEAAHGAVLMGTWSRICTLRYVQKIEGRRPDLKFMLCNKRDLDLMLSSPRVWPTQLKRVSESRIVYAVDSTGIERCR